MARLPEQRPIQIRYGSTIGNNRCQYWANVVNVIRRTIPALAELATPVRLIVSNMAEKCVTKGVGTGNPPELQIHELFAVIATARTRILREFIARGSNRRRVIRRQRPLCANNVFRNATSAAIVGEPT